MRYELSKKWIEQHGEMIQRAYSIAQVNNWDVKSKENVLEILKVVDPENANEENADIFSKILQLFDVRLKKTRDTEKNEENLLN